MKFIRMILKFKCGSCAEEVKSVTILASDMNNLMKINNEAMVILGILVAMLTEAFGDDSSSESYQGAFVTIQIACNSHVCTIYDKDCFIPRTGYKHLFWLNEVRAEVRGSLRNFLINVALDSPKRSQP